MSFVLNKEKIARIMEEGVTVDCPLFVGIENHNPIPSWVWVANEIQLETLKLFAHFFNRQCVEYIKFMIQHGGKATDNEIARAAGWYPSTVSARRNSLKKLGLIKSYPGKRKMGPHSCSNTEWELDFKELKEFFINQGAM